MSSSSWILADVRQHRTSAPQPAHWLRTSAAVLGVPGEEELHRQSPEEAPAAVQDSALEDSIHEGVPGTRAPTRALLEATFALLEG